MEVGLAFAPLLWPNKCRSPPYGVGPPLGFLFSLEKILYFASTHRHSTQQALRSCHQYSGEQGCSTLSSVRCLCWPFLHFSSRLYTLPLLGGPPPSSVQAFSAPPTTVPFNHPICSSSSFSFKLLYHVKIERALLWLLSPKQVQTYVVCDESDISVPLLLKIGITMVCLRWV